MKRTKKAGLVFVILLICMLAAGAAVYLIPSLRNYTARKLVRKPVLIAHAMGGIPGTDRSNSLEAFEQNYEKGLRIFEADFCLTSDNKLILRHDWNKKRGQKGLLKYKGYIPTYDEFMQTPLYGKYAPLSFEDLLCLMKEYPDIYLITDSKESEYDKVVSEFQMILESAEKLDALSCLDRFIVQIYNDEMYDAITSVYPFENWIYTLYLRGTDNPDQLCNFCQEHGISTITVKYNKYSKELQEQADAHGLKVYLHTVNQTKDALNYYSQGVDGFYTESITPVSWIKHTLLSIF
ncbi:MAG: hypothetical protein J6P60_05810 [Lachnospiraceae bacterium]|nr:hypothetical protein [Lachnospiraceae bacterium]